MSGLLQRLAGQALGANANSAGWSRIRSAAGVHAQVPVALPSGGEIRAPAPLAFAPVSRSASPQSDHGIRTHADAPPAAYSAADGPESPHGPTRIIESAAEGAVQIRVEASAPAAQARSGVPVRDPQPAVPQRLLDEVAIEQVASLAIAPMPVAPPPARAALGVDSHESNEVHVHIGRIEVTAVTEPERPRKTRTATPRQARPLADYLARRSRS